MKQFLCGVVAALVVLPMAALAYWLSGTEETRSDAKPPAWESMVLGPAVRAAVRRGARGLSAPPAANEEAIVAGGKLYMAGCAGCHGEPGKPYHEEEAHYPSVPQLPHSGSQYSEGEIAWIIKHGIRMTGMSAYGPFYKENEVWALAAFVRRINTLSAEEIAAIQPKKQ